MPISARCPTIRLLSVGSVAGNGGVIPLRPRSAPVDQACPDQSRYALDALYGGAVHAALLHRAVDVGTRRARAEWYALRLRLRSLARIAGRHGEEVYWGQPWPSGLAVYVYLVRGGQVVREGEVRPAGNRMDVEYRRMRLI